MGKFRCSKKYIGDISYTLRWQYPKNRFDIRSGKTGQVYYNGPNKQREPWNNEINSGMSWVYAHIYRAGAYYVGQEPYGLRDRPFDCISIEAYNKKSPQAHISLHEVRTSDIKIYKKNRSGANYDAQDLFFYTSHELGHAHHEEIYVGYKLDGVSKEIKEGWACAIGYYMMSSVYSVSIHNNPYYTNQSWRTGNGKYSPLMIDMVDNFNQKSRYSFAIEDDITGYTLKQIEKIVSKSGCKTIKDLKMKLKHYLDPGMLLGKCLIAISLNINNNVTKIDRFLL